MMLIIIMSIVCLIMTLSRYIRLVESLCFVNYVQPYLFQILEKRSMIWLVSEDIVYFLPGWFQVMPVVSWLVSGGFRWFQVVPDRSLF